MYKYRGFTLVELLVTIAIVGVLVAIAVPSFRDLVVKRNLRGAAELVYSQLVLARGQAIKSSESITVDFQNGDDGAWYLGMTNADGGCVPDGATCKLTYTDENGAAQIVDADFAGTGFPDVSMSTAGTIEFDPVRGMADDAAGNTPGSVTLSTTNPAYTMQVAVSRLGSAGICSDDVSGYPSCPAPAPVPL